MKKVVIISSHDTLCGIAKYVDRIRPSIAGFFDVSIIALDAELLRSTKKSDITLGDRHIADICQRLSSFDAVNLHIENGLFGTNSVDIARRIRQLFESSPAMCITIHWIAPAPAPPIGPKEFLNMIFGMKLNRLLSERRKNFNYRLVGEGLYRVSLKSIQRKKRVCLLVHNLEDAKRLKSEFLLDNIYTYPLSYLNKNDVVDIKSRARRTNFPNLESIPENAKIFGLFGFIAPYKGFDLAIRAMKSQSPDTHLAIFGDLAPGNKEKRYLELLQREAEPFKGRIHFCGAQSEDKFFDAIAICDVVLMPYREVGLSASGPASIALELGKRIIASRITAFQSISHFFPGQIEFFDPGDDKGLASRMRAVSPHAQIQRTPTISMEQNGMIYRSALEWTASKNDADFSAFIDKIIDNAL